MTGSPNTTVGSKGSVGNPGSPVTVSPMTGSPNTTVGSKGAVGNPGGPVTVSPLEGLHSGYQLFNTELVDSHIHGQAPVG
ncbi:hypothetical protein BDW22DRAFT_1352743 [Trametopsis cervina]|nr:hypothetical protein BDW22DRAFT_1352743 [Trametopsis cervina]